MALLFLPFVSMLSPRAHELAVVSEEEEEQENKGKKMNQGKNDPLTSPQATLTTIHIHAQTKSIRMQQE
jgi:hypothetical protein